MIQLVEVSNRWVCEGGGEERSVLELRNGLTVFYVLHLLGLEILVVLVPQPNEAGIVLLRVTNYFTQDFSVSF